MGGRSRPRSRRELRLARPARAAAAPSAPSSTGRARAGTGADLASALRGWEHLRFEVTEDAGLGTDGGRWMHTPDLGIYFAQTDTAGNVVIPEDRIRYAMEVARAPTRSSCTASCASRSAQAWDDELEPFRHASEDSPVVWLHKVG